MRSILNPDIRLLPQCEQFRLLEQVHILVHQLPVILPSQLGQREARLHLGQVDAEAGPGPDAERLAGGPVVPGQALAQPPLGHKVVGPAPVPRVARQGKRVGRHDGAPRHPAAVDVGAGALARQANGRGREEPKTLLDDGLEIGQRGGRVAVHLVVGGELGAQLALQLRQRLGVSEQEKRHGAQERGRRLAAGDDEHVGLVGEVLLVEVLLVLVLQEVAEEVVAAHVAERDALARLVQRQGLVLLHVGEKLERDEKGQGDHAGRDALADVGERHDEEAAHDDLDPKVRLG
jgi:hypothetical protein